MADALRYAVLVLALMCHVAANDAPWRPADLQVVVQQPTVFYDAPVIQLHTGLSEVPTRRAAATHFIRATAAPSGMMSGAFAAVAKRVPCYGRRCLVDVPLPRQWFRNNESGLAEFPVEVTLAAEDPIDGMLLTAEAIAVSGVAVVCKPPRISSSSSAGSSSAVVLLSLPARDLQPNEEFDIAVTTDSDLSINALSMTVEFEPGLVLLGAFLPAASDTSSTTLHQIDVTVDGDTGSLTYIRPELGTSNCTKFSKLETPLFYLRFRVGTSVKATSMLQISARAPDLFPCNIGSGASMTSMIDGLVQVLDRDFWDNSGTGMVHVGDDSVQGCMASASNHEVINMATMGGPLQTYPLDIWGITATGRALDLRTEAECTSVTPGVISTDGCAAVLTGAETSGAEDAAVLVTVTSDNGEPQMARLVQFRVLFPDRSTLRIKASTPTLLPIDIGCAGTVFQSTRFFVFAMLTTDHGLPPVEHDLTPIVWPALAADNADVVRMGVGGIAFGAGPGTTRVVLDDYITGTDPLATTITVGDGPVRTVTGIRLGSAPNAAAVLSEWAPTRVLDADAVLDDGSLFPLHPGSVGTGMITVVTRSPQSVVVVNKNELRVGIAAIPISHSEAVVAAEWRPETCVGASASAVYSTTTSLRVKARSKTTMRVTAASARVTLASDPAATAGVRTSVALRVSLSSGSVDGSDAMSADVTGHQSLRYSARPAGHVSIGSDGVLAVSEPGVLGDVVVVVHMVGSPEVHATVIVTVVSFKQLFVWATPKAAYSGSNHLSITEVSKVAGVSPPVFIPGLQLRLGMNLTDDSMLELTTDVSFESNDAKAEIFGWFAGLRSILPLVLKVRSQETRVISIDRMRLEQGGSTSTTFTGEAGVSLAQIRLGLTFDDGTKYPEFIDMNGNPAIAGLLVFESENDSVDVHPQAGTVKLISNGYDLATIVVRVGGAIINGGLTSFACNLAPISAGDCDMGAIAGIPIAPVEIGNIFKVPLRVNSGGQRLGAFHVAIEYDSTALEVIDWRHSIKPPVSSAVDVQVRSTIGLIRMAGTLDQSNAMSGQVDVASVWFKARSEGVHAIDGFVFTLENSDLVPTLIAEMTPFTAGALQVLVTKPGHKHERHRRRVKYNNLTARRRPSPSDRPQRALGECTAASSAKLIGDLNCDCRVTPGDALFALGYNRAASVGFTGPLKIYQRVVKICPHVVDALDVNHNAKRNAEDATVLLKSIVGLAQLVKSVTATASSNRQQGCRLDLSVELAKMGPMKPVDSAFLLSYVPVTTRATEDTNDPLYEVIDAEKRGASWSIPEEIVVNSVGISLIQTVLGPNGLICTLFTGPHGPHIAKASLYVNKSMPSSAVSCVRSDHLHRPLFHVSVHPCTPIPQHFPSLEPLVLVRPALSHVEESDGALTDDAAFQLWLGAHGGAVVVSAETEGIIWSHTILSADRLKPQLGSCGNQNYSVVFTATHSETLAKVVTEAWFAIVDTMPPEFSVLPVSKVMTSSAVRPADGRPVWHDWVAAHGNAVAADVGSDVTLSWDHQLKSEPPDLSIGTFTCVRIANVRFNVTDQCGNVASQPASLTIIDETPPRIDIPLPMANIEWIGPLTLRTSMYKWVVEYGNRSAFDESGSVRWEVPTLDNVEEDLQIGEASFAEPPVPTSGTAKCFGGQIIITMGVRDECGNAAKALLQAMYRDAQGPRIITRAQDITALSDRAGNVAQLQEWLQSHGGAIAEDESGVTWSIGEIIDAPEDHAAGNISGCDELVSKRVKFTAIDSCGNIAVTTARFQTIGNTLPLLITPPQDYTVPEGQHADSVLLLHEWLDSHAFARFSGAPNEIAWSAPEVQWFRDQRAEPCVQSQYATATFQARHLCGSGLRFSARFSIDSSCEPDTPTDEGIAWSTELYLRSDGDRVPDSSAQMGSSSAKETDFKRLAVIILGCTVLLFAVSLFGSMYMKQRSTKLLNQLLDTTSGTKFSPVVTAAFKDGKVRGGRASPGKIKVLGVSEQGETTGQIDVQVDGPVEQQIFNDMEEAEERIREVMQRMASDGAMSSGLKKAQSSYGSTVPPSYQTSEGSVRLKAAPLAPGMEMPGAMLSPTHGLEWDATLPLHNMSPIPGDTEARSMADLRAKSSTSNGPPPKPPARRGLADLSRFSPQQFSAEAFGVDDAQSSGYDAVGVETNPNPETY